MNKLTHVGVALLAVVLVLSGCQQYAPSPALVSVQADADQTPAQQVSERTRAAAQAVLASLTDDQRKQAVLPINDPLRKDWHFIPRERQGVMLGDLNAQQKTRVHQLMQTALSDSGYLKATDIIWLETVLYEMSNENPMRNPGKYALVIFGDPTDESAAWGWRLEGHHLSINLTYTPDGLGVTPMFFGTNPAVVQQGPLAGKRVLADEHNLAIALARTMSDEQLEQMMLAEKPRDVITGPGREASLEQPSGIHYDDLTETQQGIFLYLVSAYGHNIAGSHQLVLLEHIVEQGELDGLFDYRFAWAGPIDPDRSFYYRIHSPTELIEYSCQGRNHVHSVIHDRTDPLQQDLLKQHFEQHEH